MVDSTTAVQFEDGIAIRGTYPDPRVLALIEGAAGKLPLVIADPPFGNIVDEVWDKVGCDDREFCRWMIDWTQKTEALSLPGSALYVWGGVGLPREGKKPPFRPFLRYLVDVEHETSYQLSTPITWSKKRAYGIQWGYLFTREEVAYLVLGDHKKPRKFTVPLLDVKRGYAGYEQDVIVGYFDGCYHTHATSRHGFHEDASCPCLSPEAQASSEGMVHELLRQAAVPLGSGTPQAAASNLGREEPRPPAGVLRQLAEEEPSQEGLIQPKKRREATRDSLRLDRGGLEGDLAGHVLGSGHPSRRKRSPLGQLPVGGSDRQLCWVCTWEHLRRISQGEPYQVGRDHRGAGSGVGLHEGVTVEAVALIEKQMKYPAKSEFLRRTNVWADVTEIMRGKTHVNQKPDRLMEIPIEVHTEPGEWVLDPFAGSGTTAIAARKLGRRFVIVEQDPDNFDRIVSRLRGEVNEVQALIEAMDQES